MSAAQDALRLTAEAIVEAAALDGERTAVDAQVWQATDGRSVRAAVDLLIGGWLVCATGIADSPDAAVRDCLQDLDATLTQRWARRPEAVARRVREALAAALAEVQP